MNTRVLDEYDALCQRAREDRDKTVKPKTRLVARYPEGRCVGPHVAPLSVDYEDEKGERTRVK